MRQVVCQLIYSILYILYAIAGSKTWLTEIAGPEKQFLPVKVIRHNYNFGVEYRVGLKKTRI